MQIWYQIEALKAANSLVQNLPRYPIKQRHTFQFKKLCQLSCIQPFKANMLIAITMKIARYPVTARCTYMTISTTAASDTLAKI